MHISVTSFMSHIILGLTSSLVILILTLVAIKFPALTIRGSRFHLRRMIFHALIGISCASVGQWVLPPYVSSIVLTVVLILFGCLHIARLKNPDVNVAFNRCFAPVLRPYEHHQLPTAFYFLLSIDIVVTFFALPVAILSTLFLAIGDPAASFFGKWLQKPNSIRFRNGKTLIGAMANFSTCVMIGFAYLAYQDGRSFNSALFQSLIGASAASTIECSVISAMLEDNLTIPIVSAIALSLARYATEL